ncbi:hypothetical protein [Acidipila sp. EB88]|uniref:DinB/UmuC family translesion DNA polymerase n=1 Tax=Acidipila sp. EB88 TaxID=2305226 RepID=UPI0035123578
MRSTSQETACRNQRVFPTTGTFPDDIQLAECEPHIRGLVEKVWAASQGNSRRGRTVVLKLKTKESVLSHAA